MSDSVNPRLPSTHNYKRGSKFLELRDVNYTPAQIAIMMQQNAIKLPKFRAKLANTKAGIANTRVLCIGDSITAGAYSNNSGSGDWKTAGYVNVLAKMFNTGGVGSYSDSFMGFSLPSNDGRLVFPSPWAGGATADPTVGGAYAVSGVAGTSIMTFTPANAVDTFKIYYLTIPTAGVLSCDINGGTATTVDQNIAISFNSMTLTASLGINTLNMKRLSGGNVFVCGVEAWDSTKYSLQFINAGYNSSTTTSWIKTTSAYSIGNFASLMAPDLTMIALGVNDMQPSFGIKPSTTFANLQTLVTSALTSGDCMLIITGPNEANANTLPVAGQLAYINAIKAVAVKNNIPLVSIYDRLVSYAISNPLGYYMSGGYPANLHPTALGHNDYAQAIYNMIGNL